jgi:hypothetical protein
MLLALLAMRKFLDLDALNLGGGYDSRSSFSHKKKGGVALRGCAPTPYYIENSVSILFPHCGYLYIADRVRSILLRWFTDVRSTSLPESRGRSHEVQKPIIPDHPWISRTPSLETRSSATIFLGHSTSACARCQKGKVLGISFSRQLNSFCVHNDI